MLTPSRPRCTAGESIELILGPCVGTQGPSRQHLLRIISPGDQLPSLVESVREWEFHIVHWGCLSSSWDHFATGSHAIKSRRWAEARQ